LLSPRRMLYCKPFATKTLAGQKLHKLTYD